MSKEMECSKFCTIVEGSGKWWKKYSYIISKNVECSGFYSIVKGSRE